MIDFKDLWNKALYGTEDLGWDTDSFLFGVISTNFFVRAVTVSFHAVKDCLSTVLRRKISQIRK